MTTASYNIRLDENLKARAFPVFESYGLTPSQAIKLFLTQVAETNALPLSLDYKSHQPNAETEQAIREAREEAKTAKRYHDFDEVMEALASE